MIQPGTLEAVGALRIGDFACGTGALLNAAYEAVLSRYRRRGGNDRDIHPRMMEHALVGADIMPAATHLTASVLSSTHPSVTFGNTSIITLPYGEQPEGSGRSIAIGALDLIEEQETYPLFGTGRERLRGVGDSDDGLVDLPHGGFDLVIMNPPFTRNDIRNRQLDEHARKRVQEREIEIAVQLEAHDAQAAQVIDQTSVRTFFSPLADKILKTDRRTLAKVMPTTAIGSPAGQKEREFLAQRFQIETIITSHDPNRIYFSGNTDIHESLIVATAATAEPRPTRFIQLHRNPVSKAEALALESDIRNGEDLAVWGRETTWPAAKMRRGDWTAALFYDSILLEALDELNALLGTRLRPLGEMAHVGPGGQRCREAFPGKNPKRGRYAVLWQHETDRQRTIETTPDRRMRPRPAKVRYVEETLWPMAGRLLIGNKLRMNLTRTPAVWTGEPTLGSAWCPVTSSSADAEAHEKAWAAWLNSTPGILGLLARRTKSLTYPAFPLANLRALPCPDPEAVNIQPLIDAFDRLKGNELEALPRIAQDTTRAALDEAAARVARLDGQELAKWRTAIGREPSIRGCRVAV